MKARGGSDRDTTFTHESYGRVRDEDLSSNRLDFGLRVRFVCLTACTQVLVLVVLSGLQKHVFARSCVFHRSRFTVGGR